MNLSATNPINAANPANNAIVKASAGVGKTYLLVTRLLRLLLEGVEPDSILAITFTRKAASEMQIRLYERLYELATCEISQAINLLEAIGVRPDDKTIEHAQTLYEDCLQNPRQVRSTTFHSFCQDILQKFPMEANVPPGFDLLDDAKTYEQTAWELLYDEVTRNPESEVAKALENLFDLTDSIHSTKESLDSFLEQRADWWAYSCQHSDPISFAIEQLKSKLAFDETENSYALIFNDICKQQIYRIVELWSMHQTKTNKPHIEVLQSILTSSVFIDANPEADACKRPFNLLWSVFYNTSNAIRETKSSQTRAKKMGDEGQEEFLQSFAQIAQLLARVRERLNIRYNFELNSAWYVAGNRLIEIYQQLKAEQRLLDFTDLEWKTYQLLNHSDNALWVQYKLDQRINHLLIDEFQDTNPTQWRLLLPIMQEFQYSSDVPKSVFIVGDEKQSIYSFRRADPLLLDQAGIWLHENLQGKEFPMDMSRRSSPQIIQLVNSVFLSAYYQSVLPGFTEHSTHQAKTPGWIKLLPLVEETDNSIEEVQFRNPLEQPRAQKDDPYLEEGRLIASTIQQLIHQYAAINDGGHQRPIEAGDIMLLIRSRTHVKQYEKALREANIPYTSNNKGTLFECQEIQDMIALLTVLHSPFNDLALATVLRSPLFNCSNENLLYFFQKEKKSSWFELLIDAKNPLPEVLRDAREKFLRWRPYALNLPIHDMLDKIYFEANVIQRYAEFFPPHLVQRAQNNLSQFLLLALQIDSGRYPSIGRFLSRIETLRQADASPDEAIINNESAVRIMTIHGSKGLEAPVVFLADSCDARSSKSKHYQAIVDWPQNKETPETFRLCPTKKHLENQLQSLLTHLANKEEKEDANLLYVALTRARQALYISGTSKNTEAKGWYKLIQDNWPGDAASEPHYLDSTPEQATHLNKEREQLPELYHSAELQEQIKTPVDNEDNQTRGIIIHRALELLTQDNVDPKDCKIQILNEYAGESEAELVTFFREAKTVFDNPQFSQYFNTNNYQQAFNEIPLQALQGDETQLGIVDRLVLTDKQCYIIDYKTHAECSANQLPDIARQYQSQMAFYRKMVQNIWPDKSIHCLLLFTHFQQQIDIM